MPKPSTNQRAPSTLRLHVDSGQPSPVSQVPAKPRAARPRPVTAENSGESGHRPESTSPTTTPAPPRTSRVAACRPVAVA